MESYYGFEEKSFFFFFLALKFSRNYISFFTPFVFHATGGI